ncbi:MBL fold hydrolase [Sporomusaceae bacterium FL31]|nr:MBL fold hydrolase [Sporomusaceae bacterium FL31]
MFPTSHDSRESYGIRVEQNVPGEIRKRVIGIATDTGIITEAMHQSLMGCDALVVEANHDEEMLWQGRYPWYLKKRISGNFGHLENKQLAEGLLEWINGNTQRVVLAHLSEENNTPEIALATILKTLKRSRIAKENPELRLRVAPRYTPHELIILGED